MRHPLLGLCFCCALSPLLFAEDAPPSPTKPTDIASSVQVASQDSSNKGFVINFTNVSLVEYIRFVSRISNHNFLFQEADLPYTVTIVSEEPTSIQEIMATLIQILRVHGLSVAEEGSNLLIYRTGEVSRLGSVVSGTQASNNVPLITRVIRLNYISPNTVKELIQPMLSLQALIEAVPESNHLIITDIGINIDKVLELLKTIDTPSSAIEVSFFTPHSTSSNALLPIALNVLTPIATAEKVPFNIVEQPSTNTLIIISTPEMVFRSTQILQNLDQPGAGAEIGGGNVVVTSYTSRYVPPAALIPLAERILEPIAASENVPFSMVPQGGTSIIFITSTPNFNRRAIEVLNVLDQPYANEDTSSQFPLGSLENTNFFVYKLQYQNGKELERQLKSFGNSLTAGDTGRSRVLNEELLATLNNAIWIEATNSLVFAGPQEAINKVRELMPQIDRLSRQVYIEVLVIETSLVNSLTFGVQWGAQVSANGFNLSQGLFAPTTLGTGTFPLFSPQFQTPPTPGTVSSPSIPLLPGYNFGSVGNFITHNGKVFGSIGALLTALQTEADTKIILNPKILAQDNVQAKVFVGENVPYTTSNVNIQATNVSTGFTIDYRDIGISLEVTPILGASNIVCLQIDQLITTILSTATINGYPVPTTQKVEASTQVNVPDGFFLVISGMIRNERQFAKSGIPCLGWLPCAGSAFSQEAVQNSKTNVIIFIHPRIMDSEPRMSCITDQEGCEFNQNSRPDAWGWCQSQGRFFKNFSPICPNYSGP